MDDSLGVEAAIAAEQRRAATYRLLAALYHQPGDQPDDCSTTTIRSRSTPRGFGTHCRSRNPTGWITPSCSSARSI